MTTMIEKVKMTECFFNERTKALQENTKTEVCQHFDKMCFYVLHFSHFDNFKGKFCSVLSKMIFDD